MPGALDRILLWPARTPSMNPRAHRAIPPEFDSRAGRGLNHGTLHEARRPDDTAPEVWHHNPSGVVCLRLYRCSTVHCAGQTKHHHNRRVVHRDLHALGDVPDQWAERNWEKIFRERKHGGQIALNRFRLRPILDSHGVPGSVVIARLVCRDTRGDTTHLRFGQWRVTAESILFEQRRFDSFSRHPALAHCATRDARCSFRLPLGIFSGPGTALNSARDPSRAAAMYSSSQAGGSARLSNAFAPAMPSHWYALPLA